MLDQGYANTSIEPAADLVRTLRELIGDLDTLDKRTEPVFMAIGGSLIQARSHLELMQSEFADLSARLESEEAARAAADLGQALRQGSQLAAGSAQITPLLHHLDGDAASSRKAVAALDKIVEEVAALAINAKILVFQLGTANVDFAVFTQEIDRLRRLADEAVRQASRRLGQLDGAIMDTRRAEETFETTDAGELESTHRQLETSLAALIERQRQSRAAIGVMADKSRGIADKVGQCVGELQINDLTSQRIGHVRDALIMLCGVLGPGGAPTSDCASSSDYDWAGELDPPHKQALAAAVCRLQARQLDRAAKEFSREVEGLRGNLQALAGDASAVLAEALQVFGSGEAGSCFVRDLQADSDRASTLLGSYAKAKNHVNALIGTVSVGFSAMAADMETILSIDADMRMMGLNASLKCARLGPAGRALGVVAQELRTCSRRTEESSQEISRTIVAAIETSGRLARQSEEAQADAEAMAAAIMTAVQAFAGLGAQVDRSLGGLRTACTDVSTLLAECAVAIAIDRELSVIAEAVVARLTTFADAIGSPDLAEAIQGDLSRLLSRHYTMDSERAIHVLFAENGEPDETEDTTAHNAGGDVDAFFL